MMRHRHKEEEAVVAVRVPPPASGWRDGFQKKRARGAVDFAIATLSLRLKQNGGAIEDARIALNGVSTNPVWDEKAERHWIGKPLYAETIEDSLRLILEEATPLCLVGAMFRGLVQSLVN